MTWRLIDWVVDWVPSLPSPPSDSICSWICVKLPRNIFGIRILSLRFLNSSWWHPKVPKNRVQDSLHSTPAPRFTMHQHCYKKLVERSPTSCSFIDSLARAQVMWRVWWCSTMDIECHWCQDPLGAMMILAEIFRQARSLWPLSCWLILVCGSCGKPNI